MIRSTCIRITAIHTSHPIDSWTISRWLDVDWIGLDLIGLFPPIRRGVKERKSDKEKEKIDGDSIWHLINDKLEEQVEEFVRLPPVQGTDLIIGSTIESHGHIY